jgi:hypothetical protein
MRNNPRRAEIADAVLANLREAFGSDFYKLLTAKITHDYLDNKMNDVRTTIIANPSVFERALLGLIGPLGEDVLVSVCQNVQSDLLLDTSLRYSKIGDLAKYIDVLSHSQKGCAGLSCT